MMGRQQVTVLGIQYGTRVRTLVWALVSAYLYGALEVYFHRVGELERLEMGVRQYRSAGAEVFDLCEPRHELAAGNATLLVHQLDGRPFAVVSHAVAHKHVKLGVVVLNSQHHGHGLSDFHQPGYFGSPRSLSNLL